MAVAADNDVAFIIMDADWYGAVVCILFITMKSALAPTKTKLVGP